ncbi:MAG: hypothetical protein IPN69_08240 [Acidobacteria bacterium]|nr:hypothetical protein [Acidobacteriota bacterium]
MKKGDTVKLRTGQGIFVDFETGLEVAGTGKATIGEKIGAATKAAFNAGGLVLEAAKPKGAKDVGKAEKAKSQKTEEPDAGSGLDEE